MFTGDPHDWLNPRGSFAGLQWIVGARADLYDDADASGGLLLDLGCGPGFMVGQARAKGYRHVGVDLDSGVLIGAGVEGLTADAAALPFPSAHFDVVVAGELLEHVDDPQAVVAEACRVLKPGGQLVIDTIASTPLARVVAITVAERLPGLVPKGIHDHRLFVDRKAMMATARQGGVELHLRGLRPSIPAYLRWLLRRSDTARMVPTRSTAVLFQAWGRKKW